MCVILLKGKVGTGQPHFLPAPESSKDQKKNLSRRTTKQEPPVRKELSPHG